MEIFLYFLHQGVVSLDMNDPLLEIVLYIAGAIVTLSGALTIIYKIFKKSITNVSEDLISSSINKHTEETNKQIQELSNQLKGLTIRSEEANENLQHTLMSLCRDRINQAFDYYTTKGFIGSHSLFTIDELYDSYKKLGGNGYVEEQMKVLHSLDLKSAEQIAKEKDLK